MSAEGRDALDLAPFFIPDGSRTPQLMVPGLAMESVVRITLIHVTDTVSIKPIDHASAVQSIFEITTFLAQSAERQLEQEREAQ